MNIYLIKNQQNSGPYTKAEVMNRIGAGECTLNDMAWCDGCAGAVPLSQIIAPPGGFAPLHKLAIIPATDLMEIAIKKTVLTWLTVSWLVLGFVPLPTWLYSLSGVFLLCVHVAMVIVSWQLARLLQKNVGLWIGLTIVPWVNLFAVARLVSQASLTLKSNGSNSGLADAT
jgi:hypothetical protein